MTAIRRELLSALNEVTESESRDLIGEAAAQENEAIEASGHNLSERFALAESTGVDIARTLDDWAVLGKTRARTDADVGTFSKRRTLGV